MSNEKPRILFTGGSGAVGNHIVRALLHESVDIIRLSKKKISGVPGVVEILADITDPKTLSDVLKPLDIDMVVHAAAVTRSHDPSKYFSVNVGGTKNLLEALQNQKISRFIYVSS